MEYVLPLNIKGDIMHVSGGSYDNDCVTETEKDSLSLFLIN